MIWKSDSQVFIGIFKCHTPPWSACNKSKLKKIWLINIFNRAGILAQRRSQCIKPHGPPLEFLNHSHQDIPVILAIGPNFPPLLGRKKVTFYRLENGEYLPAAETAAHFVVVTGIVGEYLQVSSWGKEYYMFWPEYQRYVKKCSSFFASNICRIREKKKRKIFK